MVIEIRYYQSSSYEQPFVEWLRRLSDRQARTRIEARLARIAVGNLGDVEPVGEGVMELRSIGDRDTGCISAAWSGGRSSPLWRGQEDAAKGH
jgi:hypothetical protein